MTRSTAVLGIVLCSLACSTGGLGQSAVAASGGGKPAAPEGCFSCHAELSGKLHEPARLFRERDVHAAAGLTCSSCHGGDAKSQTALAAHRGAGFVTAPAGSREMAALCGRCHQKPAENYLRGPHQLAAQAVRRPDCATCHGAHGVQRASIALIAEPLCSSCHTVGQARRIHTALSDAEVQLTSLDAQLAASGNEAAARNRLQAARSQLRGLSHGLDLITVTRTAADALQLVDEVRAKSLPRLGAKDWGRRLRIAGIVVAGLVVLGAAAWGARALWARRHKLPLPRGKALAVAGSILGVVAVVGLIGSYRAYDYMEHDPKFCTSCHTMNSAFDLWEKSGHKNIECHACHVADLGSNIHQLWDYATKRPDLVVKHADVDRSICEKCHASGANVSKWNRVTETPGHRVHAGKARVECVQCHSTSVHRFKPPKETCATCHKSVTLTAAGTMAEMHCLQCHPFLAADAKRPLKPDRAACLDCHEQRQVSDEVFPAKAPMKWDCGKCHRPHERLNIGVADCKKCHDTIVEGVHRMKSHSNCMDCHKPHGWTTASTSCTGCHVSIVPAKHHPTPGKSCKDCHGAWDDEFKGGKFAKK